MAMRFIGRENELSTLEKMFAGEPSITLITGRYGIGKTRLVKEFIAGRDAMYFLALPSTQELLLKDMSTCISSFYSLKEIQSKSWDDVFTAFASPNDNRKILIIDEFQNMIGSSSQFLKDFRRIWDKILAPGNAMLILCSSVISSVLPMTTDSDNPMYGAIDRNIDLGPIPFSDIHAPEDYVERLRLYSIHGGVPYVMDRLFGSGADEAMEKILEADRGLLDLPIRMMSAEVKEPSVYLSVMSAIGEGNNRITQISEDTGVASTTLNSYIRKLMDNGCLQREVPVTEYFPERSKNGIYSPRDAFTAFWFRFIRPNMSDIMNGNIRRCLSIIGNSFDLHVRDVFSYICRNEMQYLTEEIGFLPLVQGKYWNRETSIDIIAINQGKHRALVAGCYVKDTPVDRDDLNSLIEEANKVPELRGYVVKIGLFSVSGFADDLKRESNLLLFDKGTIIRHE